MRWTGWFALVAGVLAVAGCGYGYRYRTIAGQARYSASSRPDASYFCYDCHGYRYFDPYYDYCDSRGFRYRWSEHPRSMIVYRERYVRIKEAHPDFGRYRYKSDYRKADRYREPPDYQVGRGGNPAGEAPTVKPDREPKEREKKGQDEGKKKQRKGDQRKGPRDDGSRSTLPGGVS